MVSVDIKHHVYYNPYLISLMVSVDIKHHVYYKPSLISLMVSVDVKHHTIIIEQRGGAVTFPSQ